MLKTIPLLLETMKCPINKPQKEIAWSLKLEKLKKKTKNFKNLIKMRILSKKLLKLVLFKNGNLFHGN